MRFGHVRVMLWQTQLRSVGTEHNYTSILSWSCTLLLSESGPVTKLWCGRLTGRWIRRYITQRRWTIKDWGGSGCGMSSSKADQYLRLETGDPGCSRTEYLPNKSNPALWENVCCLQTLQTDCSHWALVLNRRRSSSHTVKCRPGHKSANVMCFARCFRRNMVRSSLQLFVTQTNGLEQKQTSCLTSNPGPDRDLGNQYHLLTYTGTAHLGWPWPTAPRTPPAHRKWWAKCK